MLKLSDSRNFGRTLAGIGLIVAAVLFLVSTALDPAWADETADYLDDVADAKGRYLAAGIANLIGTMFLVAGLIGVIHLLRRRRVTLGQIGAGLLLLGTLALAATYVINVMEIEATDAKYDRAQMVEFFETTEESARAVPIFALFLLGLVLGSILLAVGLWRQKATPIWIPIALVLSSVASFAGGENQVAALISSAILAAALIGIGLRILAVSDDDWERWQVLPDQGEEAAQAQQPVRTPG